MKKFLFALSGAALLLTGTWLYFQISQYGGVVTRRISKGEIQVVDSFPLSNIFNIHADYPRLLFYKGRRFDMLQGEFPYFIEVPQLHSLLFLIGTKEHPESSLVLLDLESGTPTYIPLGNVILGTYGFGRNDQNAIRVKSAEKSRILLEDKSGSAAKLAEPLNYEINLDQKTIRRSN